ncbi:Gfo/Idh/MocA family protein [Tundrisphaera sp. TA3]|uniref:Gfo/Idh/MocA family protein n=1 Tax=Tundrisphaera sp. TA3 TaxID=3435775 RepID=UPI003EBD476D
MGSDAKTPRREFLRTGGAIAAAGYAFPTIVSGRALGGADVAPASERIRVGIIGTGLQGIFNLKEVMKQKAADVVAVCDVDKNHLAEGKKIAEAGDKKNSPAGDRKIAAFSDYRRMLDDKTIDAVLVATPDHWHALATVDACIAGKDVYCEKPLSLTVAEGQTMVDVARKHNRIVQTGSQQRSDKSFRLACELVRSGKIGKVKQVKVSLPKVNFKGDAVPDSAPPPELDYNFWLGAAPERPYNEKRVHYLFRFFWDYSGGQMTNFGAHHLDIAQWGLGRDESGPTTIEATARFNQKGLFEVAETSEITYTYDDGVKILCSQGTQGGASVIFEGEKGSISVSRGDKITSNPPEILKEALGPKDVHLYVSNNHHENWLDCIKTRKLPICDVAIGHRSATVCHLGNIAIRVGHKITWDPTAQTIVGDAEAAKMLSRPYRAPWHLPEPSTSAKAGSPTRA